MIPRLRTGALVTPVAMERLGRLVPAPLVKPDGPFIAARPGVEPS